MTETNLMPHDCHSAEGAAVAVPREAAAEQPISMRLFSFVTSAIPIIDDHTYVAQLTLICHSPGHGLLSQRRPCWRLKQA